MNWIKDPANRIYVVTLGILLIVIIAAGAYMLTSKEEEVPIVQDNPYSATEGLPPGVAPQPINVQPNPGMAQPSAAPQTAQVVQSGPMEPWRSDPFMPLGYKEQPKKALKLVARIPDLNIERLFDYSKDDTTSVYHVPQPLRRMSGILMNGRIYAVIDTNGVSEILKPGDVLKDGLASVVSIERDRVVLKTREANPRTIELRLSAASKQQVPMGGQGAPGNPYDPGMQDYMPGMETPMQGGMPNGNRGGALGGRSIGPGYQVDEPVFGMPM